MNTKPILKLTLAVVLAGIVGCAGNGGGDSGAVQPRPANDPNRGPQLGDVVVKSTFTVFVSGDNKVRVMSGNPVTLPISVINAPNVSMTVDSSGLVMPVISNAPLSFGSIAISGLTDNNLRVCGASGHSKCGTAVVRIYTSGTAGAGMWNPDGYGMPITAKLGSGSALDVGLGVANAAVVQTSTIPANKNVFRLSDFTITPSYSINSDFTEAGAGTYSTTLVVEYGLAL